MSIKIEKELLDFIREFKIVKTKTIENKFNLTQSSARRYLINLEKNGYIKRSFGEVFLNENDNFQDINFNLRINSNIKEKKEIAKKAACFALNCKTIYIDSGSLCYFLLEFLDKHIQIFTNSLSIAKRSIEMGFNNVNILGGYIKSTTQSIVNFNLEELNKINFPLSFIGVNAIDEEGNLYTPEKNEANAKEEIMNHSSKIIVLAQKEKLFQKSTFKFNNKKHKNIIIVSNNKQEISFLNDQIKLINIKE